MKSFPFFFNTKDSKMYQRKKSVTKKLNTDITTKEKEKKKEKEILTILQR